MERPPRPPSLVVGIGASAGGLEAVEALLTALPADTGVAFVVVQHLSPDFRSLMDEILAKRTPMIVRRVEDQMAVQANEMYIIPPRKEMIMSGGRLLLTDMDPSRDLNMPIDIFFRSLAQDQGERAIGIILSGTGSDGSRGVRDIHEAGGIVLVQHPETARFDGMPKSAIDTDVVDLVLAPEEMPDALARLTARVVTPAEARTLRPIPTMDDVLDLLRQEFGIDFSYYKPNTVTRRIERRLLLHDAQGLAEYAAHLREDTDELNALYRDLLIGVTRFFRDREAFERLDHEVLRGRLDEVPDGGEFRVWVAGCATGEEAYSLAILIHEHLERTGRQVRVKMFATDVHRASLEFASAGEYPEASLAEVTPERRERYFERRGKAFRVSSDLRQMVVFAPHNITRDAPFTRMDLITCRNLLIYLQPLAQKKALSLFHFALKRDGVLFLGPSESVGAVADEFHTVDERWKLYRKRRDSRLPTDMRVSLSRSAPGRNPPVVAEGAQPLSVSSLLGTYDALLDEYMPPSLLVNERRELVHAFGGASNLLQVRDGRPSLDVLDMVPPELKMPITGALQRARSQKAPIVFTGITLEGQPGTHRLTVKPVSGRRGSAPYMLICLERMDEPRSPALSRRRSQPEIDIGDISREQLGQLESELRHTKENLQATIEELETSNEELQATNEELVASNEELQSTNEELQSVNEELYSVNAEFQKKIQELTELTNDIDNLLSSTEVGTIFLDRDLRIRKFTPRIADTFNLLPQDIGRLIADFSHNITHDELVTDIRRVVKTEVPFEKEVRDRDGHWLFLRILPYRSRSSVEGAVVTLIDIGALKRAEDALFRERYLLDSLMNTLPDSVYFADAAGRFVRVNRAMSQRLNLDSPAAAVGKSHADVGATRAANEAMASDRRVLETGQPLVNALERFTGPDGEVAWMLTTKIPLRDDEDQVVGLFAVSRDITKQKTAEDQAREAVERRDEFLAMLSHELRNPLGAVKNATSLLTKKHGDVERAIGVIDRQVGQMARLLDDLLDVSRVTRNKIDLNREVFDLRRVVDDALQTIRPKSEENDISVEVALPDEPVTIDGDLVRVQQVMVNMLANAVKYNSSGGSVWLTIEREGRDAVIRVRDDGVGMRPETLASAFEPFVQSEHSLSRSDGGMGLGLTLVRSLVQLHGGSVTAHSEGLGQGSEFIVKLPLVDPPIEAPAEMRDAEASPGGVRILLVEDSADHRETLCQLLELEGYEVATAVDGRDGIRSIVNQRPDIAIIDIGLPEVDGFEVAKRVRRQERCRRTKLIALTGYGSTRDREAVAAAGFDAHIVKPVDPDELVTALVDLAER